MSEVFQAPGFGRYVGGVKTLQALTTKVGSIRGDTPLVCANSGHGEYKQDDVCTTLRSSGGDLGGGSENIVTDKQYAVRRLMPIECERLQSLPDNYTLIPHKSCTDSARYKALGNGMSQAIPNWILKRLVYYANGGEGECEE